MRDSYSARILDKYHALVNAEEIDLDRAVDQLEMYLEGVYSYTMEMKEVFLHLSIDDHTIDSAAFLYLQKNPILRETIKRTHIERCDNAMGLLDHLARLVCATGQVSDIKNLLSEVGSNGADRLYIRNNLCTWAAEGNNSAMLQWLYANDYPWNEKTCASAVKNGNIEVLRRLHSMHRLRADDCPWNGGICAMAAKYGHLDNL